MVVLATAVVMMAMVVVAVVAVAMVVVVAMAMVVVVGLAMVVVAMVLDWYVYRGRGGDSQSRVVTREKKVAETNCFLLPVSRSPGKLWNKSGRRAHCSIASPAAGETSKSGDAPARAPLRVRR